MAVRCSLGDEIGSDIGICTRLVFHHNLVAKFATELIAQHAGHEVDRAARRETDDQSGGLCLGVCRGCGRKSGYDEDATQEASGDKSSEHGLSRNFWGEGTETGL
jgi:hypothetical protein